VNVALNAFLIIVNEGLALNCRMLRVSGDIQRWLLMKSKKSNIHGRFHAKMAENTRGY
jgi:hypothetical protein